MGAFYGSVAILTERSKAFIKEGAYRITMIIPGIALMWLSMYFFYEGIKIIAGR